MIKCMAIMLAISLVAAPCLADPSHRAKYNKSKPKSTDGEKGSTKGLKILAGGLLMLGTVGFMMMRSENNSGSEYGLETDTTKQQLTYLTIMAASGVALYSLSKDDKHEVALTRKNNAPVLAYNYHF